MRWLRLILWLLVLVPACALAFIAANPDRPVVPAVLGGLVGVFFALVFAGNADWRVWDFLFGPKQDRD